MYIAKAPTLSKAVKPFRCDFKLICDKIARLKVGQSLVIERTEFKYSPVTLKSYLQVAIQARGLAAEIYIDWAAKPTILTYIYKEPTL